MRSSQVEIVSAVAAARNDYLGRASWADAIERSADEDLRRHCITRRAPCAR